MAASDDTPLPAAWIIIAKGAAGLLGGLIAADICGIATCFCMDVLWDRGDVALAYVLWVLLGAIAAFLSISAAGDWAVTESKAHKSWIYRPDARRIAWLLVAGGMGALAGLYLLLRHFVWEWGTEENFGVPLSMPHSIAYFTGAIIGMLGSRQMAAMEQGPRDRENDR